MARSKRTAGFLGLVLVFAGCGNRHTATPLGDAGVDRPAATLATRVENLRIAASIDLFLLDVDGDGTSEIVLSATPAEAPASDGGATTGALTVTRPLDDALVLIHDAMGELVAAADNAAFALEHATKVATLRVATLASQIKGVLDSAASGGCGLVSVLGELTGVALKQGAIAIDSARQVLTSIANGGPVATGGPQDDNLYECLTATPQRPSGCIAIGAIPAACAGASNALCNLFGTRDHCYQVSDGNGSTSCSLTTDMAGLHDQAPHNVLCMKSQHSSGCCNQQFVFNPIFLSDQNNNAPMALDPPNGQIPAGAPRTVILAGPPIEPAEKILLDLIPTARPLAVVGCFLNGFAETRNPIALSVVGENCARNHALPGHVLQGDVDQCIWDDAATGTVYSTIVGTGTNTRFAGLNELLGPAILATARDHFRERVTRALATIESCGLHCQGANLVDGTATRQEDGSLAFSRTGSGSCGSSDGGTGDAGPSGGGSRTETGFCPHDQTVTTTFNAEVGQGVILRVVDVDGGIFAPAFVVTDPAGTRVASTQATDVASASFRAERSGTFTITISDAAVSSASPGGAYKLYLTVAPGSDEGGALPSGGALSGQIEKGDLDSYTFTAQTGDAIIFRMTDVAAGALVPAFIIYEPAGTRVASTQATDVASASFRVTSSGTYTVVVFDSSVGDAATGDYKLYFTRVPGANKGGSLMPGGTVAGNIDEGELDSYTFTAQTGDGIIFRMTDVAAGALVPAFIIYDPAGTQVGSTQAADVASASFQAASSGTYTVVVFDSSVGDAATGDYNLYFTKAPGANKGGLIAAGTRSERIDEGELDSYTFVAQAGDRIALMVNDVAAGPLVPGFFVYDPAGKRVASTQNADVASASFTVASSGTYTIVVFDSSVGNAATGDYTLSLTTTPAAP